MKPIGYLIQDKFSRKGERGEYYNYILAANGLFVQASNLLIDACVPIHSCEIRGLVPDKKMNESEFTESAGLLPWVILKHGKIPWLHLELILNCFKEYGNTELYIAVLWAQEEQAYEIVIPGQNSNCSSVQYQCLNNVVLEIHSHPNMPAEFTSKDDDDEQGLKIYGVASVINGHIVDVKYRVGIYGYYYTLPSRYLKCAIFE